MERAREARAARVEAKVEAWAEVAEVRAAAVAVRAGEAAARAKAAVLRQDRAGTACAPNVVKGPPTQWGAPVTSSDVPSAERP